MRRWVLAALKVGLLAGLLWSEVAAAQQVYEWEDSQGLHFTDDPATIPESARITARKTSGGAFSVIPGARRTGALSRDDRYPGDPSDDERLPEPAGLPTVKQDRTPDGDPDHAPDPQPDHASNEALWRKRFQRVHQKLDRLNEVLAQTQRRYDESAAGFMTYGDGRTVVTVAGEREKLKAELERLQKRKAAAELELEDLERAASARSVPREWRR